jgi:hypothetical protein
MGNSFVFSGSASMRPEGTPGQRPQKRRAVAAIPLRAQYHGRPRASNAPPPEKAQALGEGRTAAAGLIFIPALSVDI